MGIVKSNDQERISAFKETIAVQKESKKLKAERIEDFKQMKALVDSAQKEEDARMIKMQTLVKQNDEKLQEKKEAKQFVSKRLKKRLDKIKADPKLSEAEKSVLCD